MSKVYKQDNMTIHNADCMEIMAGYEDNYFDLAVVDPPYGININSNIGRRKGDVKKHKKQNWDKLPPSEDYFKELSRVSKKQIIWGANNFKYLNPSNGWIVWDKCLSGDVDFSEAELAFTNVKNNTKIFKLRAQSNENYSVKIHPTQKPIKLYNWIYANYAEEGQTILDTHGGSFSNAIAAHYAKMGEFVGCELDEDYFKASCERIRKETRQMELF